MPLADPDMLFVMCIGGGVTQEVTALQTLQDVATVPVVLDTPLVESSGRSHTGYSCASCHSHSLENATHLAGVFDWM